MDLRSPFAASIVSLPRQEGATLHWEKKLPAPPDMGLLLMSVPQGSELDIAIDFQSVSEGVYVSGIVGAEVSGNCARCLRDIEDEISQPVGELVLYPERRAALVEEGDEEAEEMPIIESDHIDLEPIVRDAVVLALPFTPLCKPDCQGLCPVCGLAWEDLPDDHAHEDDAPTEDPLAVLEAQLRAEGASE
ncbi:MAG: YceD family protein [Actinomycetaceae bacterium]|nr:YceD family protein [Actinomycetaceae bacterium]